MFPGNHHRCGHPEQDRKRHGAAPAAWREGSGQKAQPRLQLTGHKAKKSLQWPPVLRAGRCTPGYGLRPAVSSPGPGATRMAEAPPPCLILMFPVESLLHSLGGHWVTPSRAPRGWGWEMFISQLGAVPDGHSRTHSAWGQEWGETGPRVKRGAAASRRGPVTSIPLEAVLLLAVGSQGRS